MKTYGSMIINPSVNDMKIGIINNGLGNIGSVQSALLFYKYEVSLVENLKTIRESDVLILAGVGNFKTAVSKLKDLGLWDIINEEIIVHKKPILGICLGMQLFADISYEGGETRGFGWIHGEIKKIEGNQIRIPHIGWNEIIPVDISYFKNIEYFTFYFMHSYHFIPEDKSVIIAYMDYGNLKLVAAVKKDNIIGVQFHPEKSQGDGLRVLRNILEGFK